jgi:hypothetical protein
MRTSSFSLLSDAPFVFTACAMLFLPNLLPPLRSQPRVD